MYKATHLPPKLTNAFLKVKAKAKEKMTRAPSDAESDKRTGIVDSSSKATKSSGAEEHLGQSISELFTAEDREDLEQMYKMDFATFSAAEYEAEIKDLFEDLLIFMHRQDGLDRLEGN